MSDVLRAYLEQLAVDVVERRQSARIIISISGRYSLASRCDAQGNAHAFACRAVNISTRAVVLVAPVLGLVGERVEAHIEHFGKLEGSIARLMDRGFVMSIAATGDERARIAERIIWLEKNKNLEVPDNRESARIVPHNPNSTLLLADGTQLRCFIIDMSDTGVAVSADIHPEIGTPLAVGKVVGRVVRCFAEGFAVQFVDRYGPARLEQLLIRPDLSEKSELDDDEPSLSKRLAGLVPFGNWIRARVRI